jgi:phytanoyl-CoA hydroxylase
MPYKTTPDSLSDDALQSFRTNGFVHIPGVIAEDEVTGYYDAIQTFSEGIRPQTGEHDRVKDHDVFTQLVNFWPENEGIRKLTFHPNIAAIAEKLAGVPLKLWHDHVLIKQPGKSAPTSYHQDQPFWPHDNSPNSLSAWVALCVVPVEKGCMTFLPGSHRHTDLPTQSTRNEEVMFKACPDLRWSQRITVPLKAGDCTFHHSRCAHMATPNLTDDPRVAHVIIFMDGTTTYSGKGHVVTDPLGLDPGDPMNGDLFPAVSSFADLI